MTCPLCNRPSTKDYRPFCSKRCANINGRRELVSGFDSLAVYASSLVRGLARAP